jgi:hypothetical protein
MITYDPKNWIRILLDFPRSPVFRTLFFDVVGPASTRRLVWAENAMRQPFRSAVAVDPGDHPACSSSSDQHTTGGGGTATGGRS